MRYTGSVLLLFSLLCASVIGCAGGSSHSSQPKSGASTMAKASSGSSSAAAEASARKANLPAITIHLAGDSTVSNYAATTPQEGWGQELAQFFNDKVTVDNKAIGGANVKTFKSGNWNKIMPVVQAGDYVLMQFGANDSGTAHGPVTPDDFAATLIQMADEVRAKQGIPIFVTPTAFYDWTGGKQNNARLAPYAQAMVTAGAAKNVPVVELNARGVEYLNKVGQTEATPLYLPTRTGAPDKAHFLKPGATKMAQLVAEELRRINSPLADYLK